MIAKSQFYSLFVFQLIAFASIQIAPPMQPAKEGLTNPPHIWPELITRSSGFRWTLGLERWPKVTKIGTQGRYHVSQWVTEYMVSYSIDGGYFQFQLHKHYNEPRVRT